MGLIKKVKRYFQDNNEHILLSQWTSSDTVEFIDTSKTLTDTYKEHINTFANSSTTGHVKAGIGLTTDNVGTINVKYGKTASTACAGDDERLINHRYPVPHSSSEKNDIGGSTSQYFGHTKLTDSYNEIDESAKADDGIGASAYALQSVASLIKTNAVINEKTTKSCTSGSETSAACTYTALSSGVLIVTSYVEWGDFNLSYRNIILHYNNNIEVAKEDRLSSNTSGINNSTLTSVIPLNKGEVFKNTIRQFSGVSRDVSVTTKGIFIPL